MQFLCNSGAFLQTHVFLPDPFFFLFTRFDFRRAHVPSSHSAFLYQGVVPRQEPAVDAVFSEQSCIKLKRLSAGKPTLARGSHPFGIAGINYSTDYVNRTKLLECHTRVVAGHPICVYPLPLRPKHDNMLGHEIHKLLKLSLRAFSLCDIHHGAHELTEITGSLENRMGYNVNISDTFVRMNDSVLTLEISLLADGFLVPSPARSSIIR